MDNPRDIPLPLRSFGSPRPPGLSINGREQLDDFYLIFQEQRDNMPPFLIFSSLTGIFTVFFFM